MTEAVHAEIGNTADTASGTSTGGRASATPWHNLTQEEVCQRLGVDPRVGLDDAEVQKRRADVGPNKLAEAPKEPGWHAFLRQYRDLMQLVLLGAAVVSIVALQEFSTGLVIIGLTVLNAVLGLNQEGKAAESVAALQKMLVIKAHAHRGGDLVDIPSEELVPGDIVSFEAGDKIPADGRLLVAATLEIEEAALTGESDACAEVARRRAGRRRAARRPPRHGVHELDGHARPRRDGRDRDRHVDRGRPDLRDAEPGPGGEDAAHASARPADRADHDHGRRRAGARGRDRAAARRELRRPVPRRHQPRDRRDPDRPARRRDDDALARHAGARRQGRDRQAAALGRDARLDVGDLLRQDRHAHAEPDDRAPARHRRAALLGRGRGLLDRRQDPARRGRQRHPARAVPAADGARERRRRARRRRDRRRPDRGRARRARGEGRPRRRRDAAPLSARRRGAVRLRVQAHGDLPRDGGRRAQGRSAASSRARRTSCSRGPR